MARNHRGVTFFVSSRPMVSVQAIAFLSAVSFLFFIGCGSDQSPVEQATADTKNSASTTQKSSPSSARLDPSVNVEALLHMRLPAKDLDFGWFRLFDGVSLMGWKADSNANWQVLDGALTVDAGDPGFLFTTSRFGDFELQLEYLAEETTNSGIFLRSSLAPKNPAEDCYELNIAPYENPFPTGSLVERKKASEEAITDLSGSEWHQIHCLVDGEIIRVWVDGKEAVDYRDESQLRAGYIGLQFREGKMKFRDIRIRPITYSSLPSTKREEWKSSDGQGFKPEFRDDGTLRLSGGKGYFELLQTYADFCLQARVQTVAKESNSGIFVRCIPGESMNGYECQIHHGYDQDRRAAIDAGMGAIFRRSPARLVLSDEEKPTHLTFIADGPHFATWVEGIQVVDWTDDRKAHSNPRHGLRLESGTIQLQCHDPSCDVIFESLSLAPLP